MRIDPPPQAGSSGAYQCLESMRELHRSFICSYECSISQLHTAAGKCFLSSMTVAPSLHCCRSGKLEVLSSIKIEYKYRQISRD